MPFEFSADVAHAEVLTPAIAATDPVNPFLTPAYAGAMQVLRYQPFLLTLCEGTRVVAACLAFLKSRRLNRTLEITSLPSLSLGPARDEFWKHLRDFCRRLRISHLEVGSFASASADIPALPGEVTHRARREYILDLQAENLSAGLCSNHVRNIRAARQIGVRVRRAADAAAYAGHLRLIEASLARRRQRGEDAGAGDLAKRVAALAGTGAGELLQASLGDELLSSVFVLLAERGAYYQSAGTSPKGMKCGASHLLVYEIAHDLRERNMRLFNLGGADESSEGLRRFKAGFGSQVVELAAAQFFWGNVFTNTMAMAARLLRNAQQASLVVGRE